MVNPVKKRVYEILEKNADGDTASRYVGIFIQILILLNVTAVILETVKELEAYIPLFDAFEFYSLMVFTVEYFLRLWSCTLMEKYSHPVWGRLRFALTPMAIIDLVAILPGLVDLSVTSDLVIVRILRLLRFFRLLKIARYTSAFSMMKKVFCSRASELSITVVFVSLLLVLVSSLMYFAEHEVQPEEFSSIPSAMWWAVATLSTVGYGDIYPVTTLGKIIAGIVAMLGIAIFAIPAGILGSGFVEEIQTRKELQSQQYTQLRCPHCGAELNADDMQNGPKIV